MLALTRRSRCSGRVSDSFVYGTLADRPWGRTLCALAERGITGQVTVVADDKTFLIAFDLGMIVGATSPLASDAIGRIALQNQMISSTHVAEITRRIAAQPERDEIEVLTEAAQLTPELVVRLRRRAVLQRAARTFSLERGSFSVEERLAMPNTPGCVVDVRAVTYLGARMHLHEQRLAADLRGFGSHFVLRLDALESVPDYELSPDEMPIIEALKNGTNLPELEATHRDIDPRTAQAVVYALACCGACEIEHRPTIPRTATAAPRTSDPAIARDLARSGLAQPIVGRAATPSTPPRSSRLAPSAGGYSLRPSHDPGTATAPRPPDASGLVDSGTVRGTAPAPRAASPDPREILDPPTARGTGGGPSALSALDARDPLDAPTARGTAGGPRSSAARIPTTPPITSRTLTPPATSRTQTGEPATARTTTNRGPTIARTSTARRTQALVAARTMLVEQGADYFTVLGLPFDAPAEAVRNAYLALAKQLHPDKLTELEVPDEQGSAQRLFIYMGTAFAVLTDPAKRQAYLESLARGQPTPGLPRVKTSDALPDKPPAEQAVRRAEIALKSDRPGEAVKELTRACELAPNNFDYAALLGWAKFCAASDKLAVAIEARKPLERAILRSDKPEIARFYLGRIERIVGRDREALRHFQQVLEATPNHAEAAAEVRAIEARLAASKR